MKKYKDLTSGEIKFLKDHGILNGFGGGGQNPVIRFLISIIMRDFDTAIADYHDYGYYIGGNEERRRHCDEMFYSAMVFDIYQLFLKGKIGKLNVIWKNVIAYLAYISIRVFGVYYFNFI